MRRLTLFELNEFNTELLEEAARVLPAPNLARLLELRRSEVTTEDIYDDGSLEPWVQWVSMHTGVPYAVHGIKHIGDVPGEGHPQLWEHLSDAGVSSGVWGVLNGARRHAEACRFFVPDPWTFTEDADPPELQGLIELPRFLAKNRLSVFQPEAAALAADLARAFRKPRHLAQAGVQTARMLRQAARDPDKAYVYFTAFEYLSAKRFVEYKRRHDPQLSILFVNMLAHAEHYYWDPTDLRKNHRMQYVLRTVDRVAGLVLDSLAPDEDLIFTNGFEQFNMAHWGDSLMYRQRDHMAFLQHLGLQAKLVDAHMTNDAHLYAETAEQVAQAASVLEAARVAGAPLFEVERYPEEPTKLFFRVCYREPLDEDATFEAGGRTYPFWEHFDILGRHTGRHGPTGTVFSTLDTLPDQMPNHELFDHVMAAFGVEPAQALERRSRSA